LHFTYQLGPDPGIPGFKGNDGTICSVFKVNPKPPLLHHPSNLNFHVST
jgi:hypothetical protein